MARVLVTGGCGYIGSVLVPLLQDCGHEVRSIDLEWFGNALPKDVLNQRYDIRLNFDGLRSFDAIIHLAAVANDPSCELDGRLAWETNALATMQLARLAAESGVRQFIYASSGSVYGVSDAPRVTEEITPHPISDYNKTKMVAERCVLSYADRMAVQIVRPATVCGYSPRMRLDVVVNRYTMLALTQGVIDVWGGEQMRPHIHINDMAALYLWLLERPYLTGIWNAGFENLSLTDLAQRIAEKIPARIVHKESSDPRSYRMDSTKLLLDGFEPHNGIAQAIDGIKAAYEIGALKDEPRHYNLARMKELGLHGTPALV